MAASAVAVVVSVRLDFAAALRPLPPLLRRDARARREGRRPRRVGAIPLPRERTPETRLARVEQVRLPADATLAAHRRAPGVDVVL